MIPQFVRPNLPNAIYAYGGAAGRLAEAMNVSIIFTGGSRRGKYRKNVVRSGVLRRSINFGCAPYLLPTNCVNFYAHRAVSKIVAFERFDAAGVLRPAYVDPHTATVPYLSRRDRGFDGAGIVVQKPGDIPARADFYVELLPNAAEYRVHGLRFERNLDRERSFYRAIMIQRRVVPDGVVSPIHNWRDNGCTLAQVSIHDVMDVVHPLNLTDVAFKALEALDLDFGGVDLLVTPDRQIYVLEVNSAPACAFDSATVGVYAAAFLEQYGVQQDNNV